MVGVACCGACQWAESSPTTDTRGSASVPPVSTPTTTPGSACPSPPMTTTIEWRLLETGEYLHPHDHSPSGDGPCGDIEAVLLTDQQMVDGWIRSVEGTDWSTEVVVGVSAACSSWGHTICLAEATENADGDLALSYAVLCGEVLDHESILFHAAAFADGGWDAVSAVVTFVYMETD